MKKHTTHDWETANCCSGEKCCKKLICCIGTTIAMIFAILAFVFAYKGYNLSALNYNLEIIKAGWLENFTKMNNLYSSADFAKYMTDQTQQSIDSFKSMVGTTDTTTDTTTNTTTPDSSATSKQVSADQISSVLNWAHFYGNKDAKIVIIEYSDFLCPYCQKHYNDQTVETVVDQNPDVALVFKNFPLSFHETADLWAKGLYCAGQVGWEEAYYGYIPQAMSQSTFSAESILEIAKWLWLNEAEFTKCYEDPASANAVNASISEWQSVFGVTGTPGNIVLNRETWKFIEISGAYPISEFENAIKTLQS